MSAQIKSYGVKVGLAEINAFNVAGISTITTHETAAEDINALWEQFFRESIGQKMQHKADDIIYAVYSDYEGDHTKPFRVTLGYRVSGDETSSDLHRILITAQEYAVLSAAGQQPKALIDTWAAIWSSDLNRSFQTDFEVYGPRFFQDGLHEVLIHVGVKP
ncbi:MAG: GyrI-like domain-containing protein [Alphaproteobacteria bacterium]|nr:GyrI-like domain-containing protein [Alphaproteobacteria bacterium]